MTAQPESRAAVTDIRSRVSRAAQACADVSNRTAILLEPVSVCGHDLASLMRGMGVDVLCGPHAPCAECPPVFLIGSAALGRPAMRRRLASSRLLHPGAVLCTITGTLTASAPGAAAPYDDARACLQAAGIGFMSETEVHDAAEA